MHKHENNTRLYFSELAMSGVFHSGINASMIKILTMVFPEVSQVIFSGEQVHLNSCKKCLKDISNISFKPIYLPKVSLKTLIFRDVLGIFYAFRTLLGTRRDDICFFSYILPFTHIAIVLLNKLLKRQIFICLHGQMEAFITETPLRFTRYYFRLETPLFKQNKSGYYVLLGEPIYRELGFLFGSEPRVIIIDHPYDFDYDDKMPQTPPPLRIGQIGVGDPGKGTQLIFDIAARLKDYIDDGQLELVIIGKLNATLDRYDNGLVKYFKTPLGNSKFQEEIEKLHYTLYFRTDKQGIAVASGSFFDTIKYLKPYISLDNRFISYYAGKFPGTGAICHSTKEMEQCIRERLGNMRETTYKNSVAKLKEMRKSLSLENIAISFKRQL